MTTAQHTAADRSTTPVPAPMAVSLGRLPRRRRWGLVALGVLLVVICAVVAFLLVGSASQSRPYLAVNRDIPYGAVIGAGDVVEINVNPGPGLQPIPASERDQVVGRHAAVDLFPGTLLTAQQLTDLVIPAPGQQLVGIDLKPAQVPARPLKAGDAVLLVIVPPVNLAGVPNPADNSQRPVSIKATVAGALEPDETGNVRVDVAVDQIDGPTVAAMSAASRIAVVVTTRN